MGSSHKEDNISRFLNKTMECDANLDSEDNSDSIDLKIDLNTQSNYDPKLANIPFNTDDYFIFNDHVTFNFK